MYAASAEHFVPQTGHSFGYSLLTRLTKGWCNTAWHSRAQQGTAQHSTAQHSTAQHSTAQHSTGQAQQMPLSHKASYQCITGHNSAYSTKQNTIHNVKCSFGT